MREFQATTNRRRVVETYSVVVREGLKKKQKKKVVILLQPLSIYLPTPIGVQKATFLIFFQYFEMMF